MHDPRPLDAAERLAWLSLARTEGVGSRNFFKLVERHGGAAAALRRLPSLSPEGRPLRPPREQAVRAELDGLAAIGAHLVAFPEPDYPALLRAIADPPPVLALRGRPEIAQATCVAIVGSRDASGNGRALARTLSTELARAGVTVVSGLARGIDTAAHEGALEAGGETIAVIAAGPDVAYPAENAALMERIAGDGLVLTERPPGAEPQARHFPRRNRLIAGLSRAVVVVEASLRSGSLITARLALDQGREVMAVPGSPLDERHRGTNQLLRDGATLVESAADILAALPTRPPPARTRRSAPIPARDQRPRGEASGPAPESAILSRLGPEPLAIDELMRQCHLTAAEVQDALLDLELDGRVERHHGNRVSLVQR